MRISDRTRLALATTFLAVALPCGSVLALDDAQDLADFIHYVKIAKPELAHANLRVLLDSGISDADLAELADEIEGDRFEEALSRGRAIYDLEDVVAELETRVRGGRKDLARDRERIATAIEDLVGTRRAQAMAEEILLEAGEFAVPQLLNQVTDGSNPTLRQKCVVMLEEIGRLAVAPLCAALSQVDTSSQERICSILSRIGYPQAAPYLAQLGADESAATSARQAANRAQGVVTRSTTLYTGDVAAQFAALALEYFTHPGTLTPYPSEPTNNVWAYDTFVGLVPTPVSTEIHGEVMAMGASRTSLQGNPSDSGALATYIAANLKRENDLPDGASDPIYGGSKYTPAFYAMAAGPDIAQEVLGLALDMRDTVLVRDGIAALSQTSGAANMGSTVSGRGALLESLQYADRRVRYDAALALGKALPAQGFPGDTSVVSLLSSAVRAGDATYAVVIGEAEDSSVFANWLGTLGYTVVAQGGSVPEIQADLAQSAGVDLVVIRQSGGTAGETINALRSFSITSVAPVVALVPGVEASGLADDFSDDPRVTVKVAQVDANAFAAVVDEAMQRGSGGRLSEADAMAFAIEAIETLNDIAVSNSNVFNINDAENSLIDALAARDGGIKYRIAGVLAAINTPRAQQALFDAALSGTGNDQIQLLGALARSAKSHGNLSQARHVKSLLALVKAGGDSGEAAARAHGALNLDPNNVVSIISD